MDIALVTRTERKELERRERLYRGDRTPLDVRGQIVIIVDDGIATGASLLAGIRALREMNSAAIVVAVQVAPEDTCRRLRDELEELVCLEMPEPFYGVGQFYQNFEQVTDEEVNELLDRASHRNGELRHARVKARKAF